MKTKYFEYNRNSGSEKYSEFTEAEYLKAKEEENRWFISFGDSVLECEESQYSDHFSKKDHGEYTQKDRNWKKVIPPLIGAVYIRRKLRAEDSQGQYSCSA